MKQNPFQSMSVGAAVAAIIGSVALPAQVFAAEEAAESTETLQEVTVTGSRIVRRDFRGQGIVLERFAEMARFNYGSTVVVLLPQGAVQLDRDLAPQQSVRVGARAGLRTPAADGEGARGGWTSRAGAP